VRSWHSPQPLAHAGQANAAAWPKILAGGEAYSLVGVTTIGRIHHGCPLEECKRNGFWTRPDIALWDNNRYVGKHHARITVDLNLFCWIEDLNSKNGTAILRTVSSSIAGGKSPYYFETLFPRRRYRLLNGDIIALAYSTLRGPYMMFTFYSL